jgi:hypothetical protein
MDLGAIEIVSVKNSSGAATHPAAVFAHEIV